MQTIKVKFKDDAGYYFYTFSYEDIDDLWRKIAKEERVYKSKLLLTPPKMFWLHQHLN